MKRRRHTPEQVVRKLREADRLLGEGKTAAAVARTLEVSENTYHRWQRQYGGMRADDAKRLKELEPPGQPRSPSTARSRACPSTTKAPRGAFSEAAEVTRTLDLLHGNDTYNLKKSPFAGSLPRASWCC